MFVVFLRLSANKAKAPQFMEAHSAWIARGFDEGVFLLTGNLQPNAGGGILAHNTTLAELQARVNDDPFVAENIVAAEIVEISPRRTDARLQFLQT